MNRSRACQSGKEDWSRNRGRKPESDRSSCRACGSPGCGGRVHQNKPDSVYRDRDKHGCDLAALPRMEPRKWVNLFCAASSSFCSNSWAQSERKPVRDVAHPQMRLLVIGGPVVDVRDVHEPGRIRRRRVERRRSLPFERRRVARDAIDPLAGFGGSKAQDHLASAVPKRRHQIGAEMRRAKFGVKLDARVGIGMRAKSAAGQLERKFAGRIGGRPLARGLRKHRRNRKKNESEPPQHPCFSA